MEVSLMEAILLGLFGSLVHLALAIYEGKSVPDKYEIAGHVVFGPVAGFLFHLTGAPNHLNAIFAGFFAIDTIRMLGRMHKPKPAEGESERP